MPASALVPVAPPFRSLVWIGAIIDRPAAADYEAPLMARHDQPIINRYATTAALLGNVTAESQYSANVLIISTYLSNSSGLHI